MQKALLSTYFMRDWDFYTNKQEDSMKKYDRKFLSVVEVDNRCFKNWYFVDFNLRMSPSLIDTTLPHQCTYLKLVWFKSVCMRVSLKKRILNDAFLVYFKETRRILANAFAASFWFLLLIGQQYLTNTHKKLIALHHLHFHYEF